MPTAAPCRPHDPPTSERDLHGRRQHSGRRAGHGGDPGRRAGLVDRRRPAPGRRDAGVLRRRGVRLPARCDRRPRCHRGRHARPHRAGRPPARDAALVPRLRDERHRAARAARGARRPQARAPSRHLRHVRRRLPPRPLLLQVGPRGRRGHGAVPPARRLVHLRRAGATVPAVEPALPARARPGQLRVRRQRRRRRPSVHRDQDGAARHGDGPGHHRGHGRLPGQLRRPHARAEDPALAIPEPAGQRVRRHRGRHGHQHPAAQPPRGRVRRAVAARAPRREPGGAPRGAPRADQGPRLPDGRAGARHQGHPRGVPHRPRIHHDARGRRGRGDPGPCVPRGSPSCPTR